MAQWVEIGGADGGMEVWRDGVRQDGQKDSRRGSDTEPDITRSIWSIEVVQRAARPWSGGVTRHCRTWSHLSDGAGAVCTDVSSPGCPERRAYPYQADTLVPPSLVGREGKWQVPACTWEAPLSTTNIPQNSTTARHLHFGGLSLFQPVIIHH